MEKEIKEIERTSGVKQNANLEEARKKIDLMRMEMKIAHESQQNEIQAKLREIETQSKQQMNIEKSRQAELETMKSKLKDREHEMKRNQQEVLDHYKEESRKEQQQKNRVNQEKERAIREQNRKIQEQNREEKKDRKDNEQSGLKLGVTDWVGMTDEWAVRREDSLLKNVVRHYLRNLRYPGRAMKHSAEGQIYFSIEVDSKGFFKNFNTYPDKPKANNIQDLVVVGRTPVAVTEESLSSNQVEEIFMQEVERTTDLSNNKPVVHPEERTYFFRAVFKYDKLNNDNTFQFRNAQSFEKTQVFNISHNSSSHISNSVEQDTIPAKKAVKRETKLAAKAGVKPVAKADEKREAKPAMKAKPESDEDAKPALKAKPAREPRDVDAKPHKARTTFLERKEKLANLYWLKKQTRSCLVKKNHRFSNLPKRRSINPQK